MEPQPPPPTASKRALCARCQRPPRACYCAALPSVALTTLRTRVVVLQHSKEQRQRQAISSVPVLSQVLSSPQSVAVVPVDVGAGKSEEVSTALCGTLERELDQLLLVEEVDSVLVLFPHTHAKTLTTELAVTGCQEGGSSERKSVALVVVDGTWTEAKKIVHHSHAYWQRIATHCRQRQGKVFEYVCLNTESTSSSAEAPEAEAEPTGSIYGELRKEPMAGCVSTLEAVALALRVIEPKSTALCNALYNAFRGMVKVQSQFQRNGKAEQRARYGGTPKPSSSSRPDHETVPDEMEETKAVEPTGRGVVKPYVFYTTQTDFRKRQRLVLEGDVHLCTRDQAVALCQEMNRHRKRGTRVSALPEDAFRRQQLQHQINDENTPTTRS